MEPTAVESRQPALVIASVIGALLVAACGGESEVAGQADTEAGSFSTSTSTSTSILDDTTSSSATSTTAASTTTEPTTTTTSSTTTTTTTTTTAPAPQGLPTPEDVAQQYDSLCLQTDSRDLAEKWFEPGVLDDLGCEQGSDGSIPPPRGIVIFDSCSPIPDAAGEASHRCFFYYEGGGYSIFVGDLGRGYRGLAAAFVVD